MATMKDVAKAANVSVATVSNIINGKFTTRNDTYFRVQKAISDLNYHPNFSARNLKLNRTRLLGVILPEMNSFYSEVFDGILSALKNSNMYPILKLHSESSIIEELIIDEFMEVGVAGIISVPSDSVEIAKKYREIQYQQVSVVLVERDIPDLSCEKIFFDNKTLVEKEISGWTFPEEDVVLVRLLENHSPEEEIEQVYKKRYPNGDVINVKSNKNHMFSELVRHMSNNWSSSKRILATTIDIANAAFDASAVTGFYNTIYGITGSSWKICQDDNRLHWLNRNGYRCGYVASERISKYLGSDEFYVDEVTKIEPIRILESEGFNENCFSNAGTIRVLALECETIAALEQLSVQVKGRTNCHFEFDKKSYGNLYEEVSRILQGKCEYDIIMIDKPWMQKCFDARVFLNLGNDFGREILCKYPRFITKDLFENTFRPFCIPLIAGVQAIYYRSDLFRDKSVGDEYWKQYEGEMNKPTNWTEYNRLVSFFTEFTTEDKSFKYGTMMGSADEIGLVCEFLPRQWSFNGSMLDAQGRPAVNSAANRRALESLVETYKYTNPSQLGKVRDEEIFASLLSGEIPMAIGFSNHYHPKSDKDCKYEKLIESIPLPRNRAVVGGYLLGICRTTGKEEACKEFLKLVMDDYGSIALMRMQGFVPTNAVYKNDYITRENRWMELIELVSANRCTREVIRTHRGNYISAREMDTLLGDAIKRAFKGGSIPEILEDTNGVLREMIYSR